MKNAFINDYKPLPLKNFVYEVTNLRTGEKTVETFEAHTREYLERNVLDIKNYSFKFLREEPKYALNSANKDKIIKVLDDIMDNFDFEKVKAVMDKLDWKWTFLKRLDPKDDFKEKIATAVPMLDEIKQHAADLLWLVANSAKDSVIASGGFRAEKDFYDPEDPWMRLSFEVEQWDASASELDQTE